MSFNGKTVIVTGAASGIGKTLAAEYAAAGANVVLVDVKAQQGQRHAAALAKAGGSTLFVKADVGVERDVRRMVDRTIAAFGAVHILVNNAGVSRFRPFAKLSLSEWDSILRSNLTSVFLCSREVARHMRRNKDGGAIVNIASIRALMSEPGGEAYAASKGGVLTLTHALAMSLAPDRIRVNCISPGWIETVDYEGLRKIDHTQHPSGRVGRTDDIARACLFLTDPANDFVNAANLVVDGGMIRKMVFVP